MGLFGKKGKGFLGKALGIVKTLTESPAARAVIGILPFGGTAMSVAQTAMPLIQQTNPGLVREPKVLKGYLGMASGLLGGESGTKATIGAVKNMLTAKSGTKAKASAKQVLLSQATAMLTSRNITQTQPAKRVVEAVSFAPPVSVQGQELYKAGLSLKAEVQEEVNQRNYFPALRTPNLSKKIAALGVIKNRLKGEFDAATAKPKPKYVVTS